METILVLAQPERGKLNSKNQRIVFIIVYQFAKAVLRQLPEETQT